jgi:hypothetical protein
MMSQSRSTTTRTKIRFDGTNCRVQAGRLNSRIDMPGLRPARR